MSKTYRIESAGMRRAIVALALALALAACGGGGGGVVAEFQLGDMPARFCCTIPEGGGAPLVGTITVDPGAADPFAGEGIGLSIEQISPPGALSFRWDGTFIATGREDENDAGVLKDFDPDADVGGFPFGLETGFVSASLEVRAQDCGFGRASFVITVFRFLALDEPAGIIILDTQRRRIDIDNECVGEPVSQPIVFARTLPAESGEIWRTEPSGALTTDVHDDIDPAWSPDRTRVAFASDRAEASIYELYTMDADGTDVQPATAFGNRWVEDPAWSPDGTSIAMSVGLPGMPDKDLWILDLAQPLGAGNPRQLTQGAEHDASPSWSPDGNMIAFVRDGGIHVVPADGGAPVAPVLPSAGVSSVDWSAQGRLVYSRYDLDFLSPRIWVADADGSDASRVSDGIAGFADLAPAWSPDGTRIAFVREDADGEIRRGVVHTMGADGSGPQALPGQQGDNRAPDW